MAKRCTIKGFDLACPHCGKVDTMAVFLDHARLIHCVACKTDFLPEQLPRTRPYRALRAWLLTAPDPTLED